MNDNEIMKLLSKRLNYICSNSGSISLTVLVVCMFLALCSQLAIFLTVQEMRHTVDNVRDRQLRLLCYSAMDTIGEAELSAGEGALANVLLHPGNKEAKLMYKSSYNEDGHIYSLDLKAFVDDGLTRGIRRIDFNVPQRLVELAPKYSLVYRTSIEGTEYLSGPDIYTSNEEVKVPRIDFLERYAQNIVNDESIVKKGFNSNFYCIRDSRSGSGFSFRGNDTYYGDTVFTCEGSISIGDNSVFPGRVVFVTRNGNVHIGRNVQMDNVVIMADKSVFISSDCRIKGIIYGNRISINGRSVFLKDENLVARFSSKRFVS